MREVRFLCKLFFLMPLSVSKQHKADPTRVHQLSPQKEERQKNI